jgi:hypothetical protein
MKRCFLASEGLFADKRTTESNSVVASELGFFAGLQLGHPLPRCINVCNSMRGISVIVSGAHPGGGGSPLALQEFCNTNFSSGIFSVKGGDCVVGEHCKVQARSLVWACLAHSQNAISYAAARLGRFLNRFSHPVLRPETQSRSDRGQVGFPCWSQ